MFTPITFNIPNFPLTITTGSLMLLTPDVYTFDHYTILRIIASTTHPIPTIISDKPINLFTPQHENEIKQSDFTIAWRYNKIKTQLLNLNKNYEADTMGTRTFVHLFQTFKNRMFCIFDPDIHYVDFYQIKKLCRKNNNTIIVTGLCEKKHFDNVVNVKALNGLLGYHGLLELERVRWIGSVFVENRRTRVVGYKIKKEGIVVEDVVIPPGL